MGSLARCRTFLLPSCSFGVHNCFIWHLLPYVQYTLWLRSQNAHRDQESRVCSFQAERQVAGAPWTMGILWWTMGCFGVSVSGSAKEQDSPTGLSQVAHKGRAVCQVWQPFSGRGHHWLQTGWQRHPSLSSPTSPRYEWCWNSRSSANVERVFCWSTTVNVSTIIISKTFSITILTFIVSWWQQKYFHNWTCISMFIFYNNSKNKWSQQSRPLWQPDPVQPRRQSSSWFGIKMASKRPRMWQPPNCSLPLTVQIMTTWSKEAKKKNLTRKERRQRTRRKRSQRKQRKTVVVLLRKARHPVHPLPLRAQILRPGQ